MQIYFHFKVPDKTKENLHQCSSGLVSASKSPHVALCMGSNTWTRHSFPFMAWIYETAKTNVDHKQTRAGFLDNKTEVRMKVKGRDMTKQKWFTVMLFVLGIKYRLDPHHTLWRSWNKSGAGSFCDIFRPNIVREAWLVLALGIKTHHINPKIWDGTELYMKKGTKCTFHWVQWQTVKYLKEFIMSPEQETGARNQILIQFIPPVSWKLNPPWWWQLNV